MSDDVVTAALRALAASDPTRAIPARLALRGETRECVFCRRSNPSWNGDGPAAGAAPGWGIDHERWCVWEQARVAMVYRARGDDE